MCFINNVNVHLYSAVNSHVLDVLSEDGGERDLVGERTVGDGMRGVG